MSKSHGRRVNTPPPEDPEKLRTIPLTLRVVPALADRMRSAARSKGYRTVQEWARAVVIAATS